ncbi:hypothetical protein [Xanthomonas euvesicatoria]|uniref:hypothetical protein n=1 Tax=Xanthomonas TaxID=338 RepID=UPI0024580872|nr:hypothetical protein [Xanthomonas euvesicatoria]MDH4908007.1 hypothetical protein [Xanthomonas euvesicatoria]
MNSLTTMTLGGSAGYRIIGYRKPCFGRTQSLAASAWRCHHQGNGRLPRDIEDRLYVHSVLQSSHWQYCGDARAPRAPLPRSKGAITGKLALQRWALQRRFTA